MNALILGYVVLLGFLMFMAIICIMIGTYRGIFCLEFLIFFGITVVLLIIIVRLIITTVKAYKEVKTEASIEETNREILKDKVYYDGWELTVCGRTSAIRSVLIAEPITLTAMQHHDAEVVYTSATVGGVTAGGFHVNPERYSMTGGRTASGKYRMVYKSDGKRITIRRIKLSSDLLAEAKKTPRIASYVNKDYIVCENELSETTKKVAQQYIDRSKATNRQDYAYTAGVQMSIEAGLTENQCDTIIGWLAGEF